MRFVDANIFVHFLVEPATPADAEKAVACRALFQRLQQRLEAATTSEAVLAEVAYVLGSPRQFALTPPEIAARMKPLLAVPGLKIANKRLFLRAFDLFATHPRLDFEDALTAAIVERMRSSTLYSYDRDFDRVGGITRIEPESPTTS